MAAPFGPSLLGDLVRVKQLSGQADTPSTFWDKWFFISSILLSGSKIEILLKRRYNAQFGIIFVLTGLIFPQSIARLDHGNWALFSVMFCMFVLRGVISTFVTAPVVVGMQKMIPAEFRARVFSVMNPITQGIPPLG